MKLRTLVLMIVATVGGSMVPARVEAGFTASYSTASITNSSMTPSLAESSSTGTTTGVTFGALTRAGTLQPGAGSGYFNSNTFSTSTSDDKSAYLTFTISVASGETLTLSSLVLGLQRNATGPTSLDIRSSLNGYISNVGTISLTSTALSAYTVNLGSTFAALTGSVTFEIFGYNAQSTAGLLRVEDTSSSSAGLVVNGNVSPVPLAVAAPSSMVLMGLGVTGIGLVARRRLTI